MSESSIVKISLLELDVDFPEGPDGLDKRVITTIENAWKEGSLIDRRGVLWVRVDKLWIIWRTDKNTAKELYLGIPEGKFRREINGSQHVRGCEVLKFIAYRLEGAALKKKYGLSFAQEIFLIFRKIQKLV